MHGKLFCSLRFAKSDKTNVPMVCNAMKMSGESLHETMQENPIPSSTWGRKAWYQIARVQISWP